MASTSRSSEKVLDGAQLENAMGSADARSLGLGLLAGALGSVPAVVRGVSASDGPSIGGLVGLCALPMMVVAPVVLAARRSRGGRKGEPPSPVLAELGAALLLASAPLIWFAGWIAEHTHHRPLGAVTFAWIALALLGGAFVVARRLIGGAPRLLRLGCLGAMGALGAYLLIGGSRVGFAASRLWLDAAWLVVCAAVAVGLPSKAHASKGASGERAAPQASPRASASSVESAGAVQNETKAMHPAWRRAVGVWLFASCVGVLALLTNASEMTAIAPIFTWPLR